MKIEPLVSVITPVFNGERYLRETINSVLAQTYKNIEYIIIDGASTDKTLAIAKEYGSAFAKVISEADFGMYNAINKGIRLSSGDIVCYLNADDVFCPNAVQLAVDQFMQFDVDMCFGNCIMINEQSQEIYRSRGVDLSYGRVLQLGRIPFLQPAAFWTRSLYDRVGGFNESFRYVADTHFFYQALRIADNKRIHFDQYIVAFRIHNEGFSTKAAQAMILEHERVLSELGVSRSAMRMAVELFVKWKNRHNLIKRMLSGAWL